MEVVFNPGLDEIIASPLRRIVFIHVGKCAGGSAIHYLMKALPNEFILFEMHCYDANATIRKIVAHGDDDMAFLVATREPISRFVSSYNWDKHVRFCSGKLKVARFRDYYQEFDTVDGLALALGADDAARQERAIDFARFAHMGMGQSWYTPLDIVPALPHGRTFLCDTSTLNADLDAFIERVNPGGG